VAIVGVGGLGAPAAAVLAASGASLALFDYDRVELSNLPRQPLFGVRDVGRPKVEVAAERIRATFPSARVEARSCRVDEDSARAVLEGMDVIVDATDGLPAKALLNQVALDLGTPLVHAGVLGLDGQLFTVLPRRSACLRCLFHELPAEDDLPTCQQAGVLGPVVGAVGIAAAREALDVALGNPPRLADRLAILDGYRLRWREVGLRRDPACHACGDPV
jgi:adenylyltransferase/sulfurtransferase